MRRWQRCWTAAAIGGVLLGVVAGCTPIIKDPAPTLGGNAPSSQAVSTLMGRAAHTATTVALDTVVVVGGCVIDGCADATASTFIVDRQGSRETGPMHTARDAHVAVRLGDGSLLVVGGFTGEGRPPLATGETYDLATGEWTSTGDLTVGRGGHAAALLGDGRVLVAGGWVASRTYTETIELFDPISRTFSRGPRLPAPADGLTATSLDDGSVLIVGGQVRPGVATGQAVIVSADGRRADRTEPLAAPRFKHAAVRLPSGEVLIIGGTSDDLTMLKTTEIYDPRTRSFRPGPTMSQGRYKLAGGAAVLPDGRVVVAGSASGLEVLDLASSTSHVAAVGPGSASSFATTSVIGDRLRVIGGYDRSIRLSRNDLTIDLVDL